MKFRMLMAKKETILELYFLFIFIFCTDMKENQGLKDANKGLDWLVSFIQKNFPCNALVVKDGSLLNVVFFYSVHENALAKNSNIHY